MARTPEGRVKDAVKRLFKQYEPDLHYFMPVQCGYGSVGLDFHCVYRGRAFFVETKAGRGKLTPRQRSTIAAMERAGGVVFVVTDDPDTLTILEMFLCNLTRNPSP